MVKTVWRCGGVAVWNLFDYFTVDMFCKLHSALSAA
jgi:hypothetical protein